MVNYNDDIRNITVKQIQDLFHSVKWNISDKPDRLLMSLKNSETLITAWDNYHLIGLTNAFSDISSVVYIHYVITHHEYQKQGIGRRMMNAVLAKYEGYKHLILISNNCQIGFFQKCGFNVCEGATAMEIRKEQT